MEQERTEQELTKAKTGKDFENPEAKPLNPLEEARKLHEETKRMQEEIRQHSADIQGAAANMILAGRAVATPSEPQKTEAEVLKEIASARVNRFLKGENL